MSVSTRPWGWEGLPEQATGTLPRTRTRFSLERPGAPQGRPQPNGSEGPLPRATRAGPDSTGTLNPASHSTVDNSQPGVVPYTPAAFCPGLHREQLAFIELLLYAKCLPSSASQAA